MAKIDLLAVKRLLDGFDFRTLFVEELGWSRPRQARPVPGKAGDLAFTWTPVSELGGVMVALIESGADIPDSKGRRRVLDEISKLHHENLLIFVNAARTQSLWLWAKRENGKVLPREHLYVKGQPGDLFLSRLGGLLVDFGDFDASGDIGVLQVAGRLRDALDVERVTKKFYREFQDQHLAFLERIEGIDDERDRRWYASVLLNRLMFIYFLQAKYFLDGGNLTYLQDKLKESEARGPDRYYDEFLRALFFQGFAKPEEERTPEVRRMLGKIRYLNGGLFLPHRIEEKYNGRIRIPDAAFRDLLALFAGYSWNLNDTPGGKDNEINPDVLGYIFEKYINQKAFGAYYTRTEITEYLCEQTIHRLILQRVNGPEEAGLPRYGSLPELLMKLDAGLCKQLLWEVLPRLSLLDPACGSGAFLVAAMKTLIDVYSAVTGRIEYLNDPDLTGWRERMRQDHPSLNYYIKKRIISDNLFGVDIMEEATEIARLRLFLALVSSVQTVDQLEPLPNIDFNILAGNSLVGLLRVDEAEYDRRNAQQDLFAKSYRELVREKNAKVDLYRHAEAEGPGASTALRDLRREIDEHRARAQESLNYLLLSEFRHLGIKYEEATWDLQKNKEGKPKKRGLELADISALQPFHWGYEFDEVINGRGGFDAIITNPPWDAFKPDSKEFFQEHSDLVSKNKMMIRDFEKEQAKVLKDPVVRVAWLNYLSRFSYQNLWFRNAPQYGANQYAPIVNGKKASIDLNLFKLFTEQSCNLLRLGGECGIVIPSGIYTDLGCRGLREMLFRSTRVSGLFGFENRKMIFEGVDSRFKFVVLSFEKGGRTEEFPVAFMRHAVEELAAFPQYVGMSVSVDLIRRLAPDSLAIMEFRNEFDAKIAERLLRFPTLGARLHGTWNIALSREFHMTGDSVLFKNEPAPHRLPLFEGKIIHQFTHTWAKPKYWINEVEGRQRLLDIRASKIRKMLAMADLDLDFSRGDIRLDYDHYRLGFRDVAASTNERTFIATVLPPKVFCPHTMSLEVVFRDELHDAVLTLNTTRASNVERLFAAALFNSFVVDYQIRRSVTSHLSFFFVYNLNVPRLSLQDPAFPPIAVRAARLICTTPEFDALAREVGLDGHADGVTDSAERARIRAELDGMVAHLYGLTEEEFSHILGTFPLVAQEVKDAALDAYRAFTPQLSDPEILRLIAQGESATLEFKSTARWDVKAGAKNAKMEDIIVKTVAAFLNSSGGDLLIGVADDGSIYGLDADYRTLGDRPNPDGFEQWLTQLLGKHIGFAAAPLLDASFHEVDGKQVCRVTVKPSPKPVWVKTDGQTQFFIRTNNSSRALSPPEAVEYATMRWK